MASRVIQEKSMTFAVRIVKLYQYLASEKHEYVLSKQVLRSGTSIGANVSEAQNGQSVRDFTAKMSIALSEAAETAYWLELLERTDYITASQYESMNNDCQELQRILTSIVKTSRNDKKSPKASN